MHEQRLERGVGPLDLSPSEALRLASEGRRVLVRRSLPPDDGPSTAPDTPARDADPADDGSSSSA